MASAWTGTGPVTLPPRSLAYGVGAALLLLAFVGVGMGLRAAWREGGAPDLAGAGAESADSADTLIAKPIVELPPPTVTNAADNYASDSDKADSRAAAIEEKTAEAQQIQATPSKSGPNIDQIFASPSERPTAPAKSGADEAAPPPPVKSDVPF